MVSSSLDGTTLNGGEKLSSQNNYSNGGDASLGGDRGRRAEAPQGLNTSSKVPESSEKRRSLLASPISPPQTPTSPTMGNSHSKAGNFARMLKQKITPSHKKTKNTPAPLTTPSVPTSPTTEQPKEMHMLSPTDTTYTSHNGDPDRERKWDPRATANSFRSHNPSISTGPRTPAGNPDDYESRSSFSPNGHSPAPPRSPIHIIPDETIEKEIGRRWILNLSLHFRDRSYKEKFFVTYLQESETGPVYRRLTISCDYRDAEKNSLEEQLSQMRFQKDKSAKIYKTIRDSLRDVKFYDTATNLKLETVNGGLHINVTEDHNEIIPYPHISVVTPLKCQLIREGDLTFDSHLSGYVYKVKWQGKTYIKKEIPGPHTVDEFLYEINALFACHGASNVIAFGGVVVDDKEERVRGLLIDYAARGALIDIIYDDRDLLSWELREKWAGQIIQGLSEIHEAGYVQGDFTLSNIVVDDQDNAKIIDINRRGCPVGWEPPELAPMIESFQRIAMYIGVKSDLYQLGMVLWALAMVHDEPELEERPLGFAADEEKQEIPEWYRNMVYDCLQDRPQSRPSAKELLQRFQTFARRGSCPQIADAEPPPEIYGNVNSNGYSNNHDFFRLPIPYPPAPPSLSSNSHSHSQTYPYPSTSSAASDTYVKVSPPLRSKESEGVGSVYSVESGVVKVGSSHPERVDSGFCEGGESEDEGRGGRKSLVGLGLAGVDKLPEIRDASPMGGPREREGTV